MISPVVARDHPVLVEARRFSAAYGRELTVAGTRWRSVAWLEQALS